MATIGNVDDMLFFPFDSLNVGGVEDRIYYSQDWADYFGQFIGNGVFPNPSNNLKIESLNNSLVLTLRKGSAFAKGVIYVQKRDFTFSITKPHLTLGRKDIIVCRLDNISRTFQPLYIAGTASATPVAPSIIRNDDTWDLLLCTISVGANATSITTANLTDNRPNNTVCGFVTGLITQVDTTNLFNQYQNYLNSKIIEWDKDKADAIEEFDNIKEEARETLALIGSVSFSKVELDFESWVTKKGLTKYTTFVTKDNIKEEWKKGTQVIAERTSLIETSKITETIKFYEYEFDISGNKLLQVQWQATKTTTFEANGSIKEVVI